MMRATHNEGGGADGNVAGSWGGIHAHGDRVRPYPLALAGRQGQGRFSSHAEEATDGGDAITRTGQRAGARATGASGEPGRRADGRDEGWRPDVAAAMARPGAGSGARASGDASKFGRRDGRHEGRAMISGSRDGVPRRKRRRRRGRRSQ